MTKLLNNPVIKISEQHAEHLLKEEKETLAFGFNTHKTFTTVDLWNIQRQRKNRAQTKSLNLADL